MNSKDRRKIEYLDDIKFARWLEKRNDPEKKGVEKMKKPEKSLTRLLPLIEAIRNNRYLLFQKLYVWGVYLQHNDMMCLVKHENYNSFLQIGRYACQRKLPTLNYRTYRLFHQSKSIKRFRSFCQLYKDPA